MTSESDKAVLNFIWEAEAALRAATTIGQRSCRDGDHLNYGNHDRLIAEARRLRAHLGDAALSPGEGS